MGNNVTSDLKSEDSWHQESSDLTTEIPARTDKLALIRDIWERWVQLLPLMFNPGPEVTVDELLVPFPRKCPFRQYMPSKPGKYGINIWAACDAKNSYAWNLQIYLRKWEKSRKTRGLQYDYWTAGSQYHLSAMTLDKNLPWWAQKNKPELPAEVLQVKDRAPLSSKFAFTDTTVVSYI